MALYSIGYVARYYGVSVSTIRRWEAKGIIPKSIRTFGGHRRFDLAPSESSKQGLHKVMPVFLLMIKNQISVGKSSD